jgi:hypothetical protein
MKPTGGAIRQHNQSVLDGFVAYRKATRGLTKRGEQWLNQMLGRYLRYVQIPVEAAQPTELAQFLAPYADRPFQRHGLYRALKSFCGWLKRLRYISDKPMEYIDPPKVPDRILNTVSPEQARILIDSASCTWDKASSPYSLTPVLGEERWSESGCETLTWSTAGFEWTVKGGTKDICSLALPPGRCLPSTSTNADPQTSCSPSTMKASRPC